mgnify:CR=1 FL=1
MVKMWHKVGTALTIGKYKQTLDETNAILDARCEMHQYFVVRTATLRDDYFVACSAALYAHDTLS